MALAAVLGQLPLVIVVVAGDAFGRQGFVEDRFAISGREGHLDFFMADLTGTCCVFAQQGKSGSGLMVKFQSRVVEAPGRMAGAAIRGKLAEMHVVMAVRAGHGHRFIGGGLFTAFFGVAFLAGDGKVLPGQREAGVVVIE